MTTSSKYSIFLFALVVLLVACGCEKKATDEPQQQQEQIEPADLSLIEKSVVMDGDCLWSGKPQITLRVTNPNKASVRVQATARVYTDRKKEVEFVTDSITVPGETTQDYVLTTTDNLAPGFYSAACHVNGKKAGTLYFGIDPFDIVSAPDKQPDYDQFWQTAKDQLATVDMNARLTEIPERSNAGCTVYLVEMNSIPDGLSGEPVVVRGYYCEPTEGKKPVIFHFYGYDTQGATYAVDCPYGSSEYAEFYLSHRGQYLNNRPAGTNPGMDETTTNIYGDWFAYHFGDKDSYYYRGAFMDCVQAIRFVATREACDMTRLFAEGSSQGGALCYAAAALSDYPFKAITPNVAFLGDFPDYFDLVSWPGEVAKAQAQQKGMTEEEMYAFLSYFDTKNLATRIRCAVLATSGGRDQTCPPHTNIAPFNNLQTPAADKEYHFYPEMTHDYPREWWTMIMKFFRERM